MKTIGKLSLLAAAIASTVCLTTVVAQTADGKQSIAYKMKVERAAQAAVWAIPAVAIWDVAVATRRDLGGDVGDVVYFSKPMVSRHGFLTANDVTPYVIASLTTTNGPLVVEVPAAGEKAAYFGSFLDAWQVPIVDVGLSGEDKGKGGKYLFLPPGYTGAVPEGYLIYRPLTYAVEVAFRPVAKNGGTIEEVVEYGKSLKIYKLSEAANPPQTRFIDAYPRKWNTLPTYDINYFKEIDTIVQKEPVLDRDKAMMALLASIGIEKGKPFAPDSETTKALEEGAATRLRLDAALFHDARNVLRPHVGRKPVAGLESFQRAGQTGLSIRHRGSPSDRRAGWLLFLRHISTQESRRRYFLSHGIARS